MNPITTGNDTLFGTTGNDTIRALAGNDWLDGGLGNDQLYGEDGDDTVAGGAGLDTLVGGNGNDTLIGDDGNDSLSGDAGNDLLFGDYGNDILNGGLGSDDLEGGLGADTLYGQGGNDYLIGGDGDDLIVDSGTTTTYGADASTDFDEILGGAGNDKIYAGGNDTVDGEEGNDIINLKGQAEAHGGSGDDIITLVNANVALGSLLDGGYGNDSVTGGAGNDTLHGGGSLIDPISKLIELGFTGKDTLVGGKGNDEYHITFDEAINGQDVIRELLNEGTDTVYLYQDQSKAATAVNTSFTLSDNIENAVIADYNVDDVLATTYSLANLTGNALNNVLTGSALDDILNGALGNDTVSAGAGNDKIYINTTGDVVNGGNGVDLLVSTIANATVNLNSYTSIENGQLDALAGTSNLLGTAANNILAGNTSNNRLEGGAGNDTLIATALKITTTIKSVSMLESDTAKAGGGTDTLIGGLGNDIYYVDDATDLTVESRTTGGIDKVFLAGGANLTNGVKTATTLISEERGFYQLQTGVENLELTSLTTHNAVGNELSNYMVGNTGGNILRGGVGSDTLDGGAAADSLQGGYGDDVYYITHANGVSQDIVREEANEGENDEVRSITGSIDLGWDNIGDIEHASLQAPDNKSFTSAYNLTGDEQNNRLTGNDGKNEMRGGLGIDTLIGGKGDDTYFVDIKHEDKIIESYESATAGNADLIKSTITFSLAAADLAEIENLTLDGAININATGNAKNNILTGNSGINLLDGGIGNDTLDGGAGKDSLKGGVGNDTYKLGLGTDGDIITEGLDAGSDTLEVANTFSLATYANVENLLLTGTGAFNGTGNALNNMIAGNSLANTLNGGDGNDTLIGGGGVDSLNGGKGTDFYDLKAGESTPTQDIIVINAGDTGGTIQTSDKVINFNSAFDDLNLISTKVAADTGGSNGIDVSSIHSHKIISGLITFDDVDSYSAPVAINATNLSYVLDYLKANITDGSTVVFNGVGTGLTADTSKLSGSSSWIFQDNGANDTLIELVGANLNSLNSTFII